VPRPSTPRARRLRRSARPAVHGQAPSARQGRDGEERGGRGASRLDLAECLCRDAGPRRHLGPAAVAAGLAQQRAVRRVRTGRLRAVPRTDEASRAPGASPCRASPSPRRRARPPLSTTAAGGLRSVTAHECLGAVPAGAGMRSPSAPPRTRTGPRPRVGPSPSPRPPAPERGCAGRGPGPGPPGGPALTCCPPAIVRRCSTSAPHTAQGRVRAVRGVCVCNSGTVGHPRPDRYVEQ